METYVVAMVWFIVMAVLAAAAFAVGLWAGRGGVWRARLWLAGSLVLLLACSWLNRRPDVALQIIRPGMLSYLEGIYATPVFMLILGIAWMRGTRLRQRGLTILAVCIGIFFFLHGGLWMLQSTPLSALANDTSNGMILQTQDFSCVPASCATALNAIGIPSTEAQMAELTQTRSGSGATLVRAVDGLSQRLADTPWKVELIETTLDSFDELPLPALTVVPGRNATIRHMVVILKSRYGMLLVADPADGPKWVDRREFAQGYNGYVIVFHR